MVYLDSHILHEHDNIFCIAKTHIVMCDILHNMRSNVK